MILIYIILVYFTEYLFTSYVILSDNKIMIYVLMQCQVSKNELNNLSHMHFTFASLPSIIHVLLHIIQVYIFKYTYNS